MGAAPFFVRILFTKIGYEFIIILKCTVEWFYMELPKRKPNRLKNWDYSQPGSYFITVCTHGKRKLFGHVACKAQTVGRFTNLPLHGRSEVSKAIGYFKMNVSKRVHRAHPDMKAWQRSFHYHIIRDEQDYILICEYIDNNPVKWKEVCFY